MRIGAPAGWMLGAVLGFGLAAPVIGQKPVDGLRDAWFSMLETLNTSPKPIERLRLLDGYLRRPEAAKSPENPYVLSAHYRRGREYLLGLRVTRAERDFRHVLRHTASDERDRRPSALLGVAQCLEIAGLTERARATYAEIERDFPSTSAGKGARLGRQRVDAGPPRIGSPLPEFSSRPDTEGTMRRVRDLRGEPALLLFTDPKTDAELCRSLEKAFTDHGYRAERIWEFRIVGNGSQEELPRLSRRPTFAAADFLDPTFMRYQIQESPTWLLVGPDGTLLGRNLPPKRLAQVMKLFRERS